MVSSEANELCDKEKRSTLMPEHILAALEVSGPSVSSCRLLSVSSRIGGFLGEVAGPFVEQRVQGYSNDVCEPLQTCQRRVLAPDIEAHG